MHTLARFVLDEGSALSVELEVVPPTEAVCSLPSLSLYFPSQNSRVSPVPISQIIGGGGEGLAGLSVQFFVKRENVIVVF